MSVSCVSCKHSLCKLRILLPNYVDFGEYVGKAQRVFSSPIISFLKENSDTCTIKSYGGKELKEVQINLAYECTLKLEASSPECQCNFAFANNPYRIAKAVYRKKQSAEKAELNLYDT